MSLGQSILENAGGPRSGSHIIVTASKAISPNPGLYAIRHLAGMFLTRPSSASRNICRTTLCISSRRLRRVKALLQFALLPSVKQIFPRARSQKRDLWHHSFWQNLQSGKVEAHAEECCGQRSCGYASTQRTARSADLTSSHGFDEPLRAYGNNGRA